MSMLIACLLNIFQGDTDSEKFAIVAFSFFTIAVIMVALEEFFSLNPNIAKKLKSLFRIWKK